MQNAFASHNDFEESFEESYDAYSEGMEVDEDVGYFEPHYSSRQNYNWGTGQQIEKTIESESSNVVNPKEDSSTSSKHC